MKTKLPALLIVAVMLSGTGCSTVEKVGAKVRAAFYSDANQKFLADVNEQARILGPIAAQALVQYFVQGGRLSNAQGASIAGSAITAEVQNMALNSATKIQLVQATADAVTAYGGDKNLKAVGLALANDAFKGLPANPSPQQAAVAVNAVSVALSQAANPANP
tara:strand:- start:2675 stop:3163 length:489 start_codon:yes stop_codon:yes gene_type:complete